eukprot:818827-Prymnesium_polylepis.1
MASHHRRPATDGAQNAEHRTRPGVGFVQNAAGAAFWVPIRRRAHVHILRSSEIMRRVCEKKPIRYESR